MKRQFSQKIVVIGILFSIVSCVPKSDYEKLQADYDQLKTELEDCKFGADKLYKQAQAQLDKKEYELCISTIEDLQNRHSGSEEAKLSATLKQKAELGIKRKAEAEKRAEAERIRKEKQRLANTTSKLRKNYDDMREITWYYDKTTTQYVDVNSFHLYMGKKKDSNPFLRLKIQYSADDWLFIESYMLKVDGKTYNISEDSYGEIKTDNGSGGIWEWLDRSVSASEYEIVKAVANSKSAKLRHNGKDYYKDRTITYKEKVALKNILNAYEALGGKVY